MVSGQLLPHFCYVHVHTCADQPNQPLIGASYPTKCCSSFYSIGPHYDIYVTPSSPVYYQYTFDNHDDLRSVTLYIKSEQDYYCSNVIIQKAQVRIYSAMLEQRLLCLD